MNAQVGLKDAKEDIEILTGMLKATVMRLKACANHLTGEQYLYAQEQIFEANRVLLKIIAG